MIALRRAPEPVIRLQGKPFTIMAASALAVEEHGRGNLQAALDIYGRILAKVPNYAEGHNNRGAILQMMNRPEEALAGYDKAIALKPDYPNAHYNRGIVLKKLTRREEALASYDRAIALNPDHVEAYNNRGVVLQELKRYDDALASYDKVIALKPDHAEAHNNRGIVLASKGDMAGAEKMFLKALELRTEFADPLFNLANIRSYQDADGNEAKSIRALLGKPNITPEEQEHLYFSLGKIYDDCGRHDDAFECFGQANKLRNSQVAYDAGMVKQMTDRIIEVFNRDFLASPFAFASSTRLPLFIVGMPRSGTTLLASMLSNHPAIAMAGELTTISDFAVHLQKLTGGAEPYPMAARSVTAGVAGQLIGQYEKRLRQNADPAISHVIDKNPLNFRHIGLIHKVFPGARIFHCTRHPLATCLSNYFQRFPLHMDYSFDLQNIGHFYGEYAQLMNHWRTIPGLNVMEVSYEDMVLNTENTARATLKFLGLEWDERCLIPHANKYAVETASHWQVRQPIYQHSLENWRHYEKHLAPLIDILSLGDKSASR